MGSKQSRASSSKTNKSSPYANNRVSVPTPEPIQNGITVSKVEVVQTPGIDLMKFIKYHSARINPDTLRMYHLLSIRFSPRNDSDTRLMVPKILGTHPESRMDVVIQGRFLSHRLDDNDPFDAFVVRGDSPLTMDSIILTRARFMDSFASPLRFEDFIALLYIVYDPYYNVAN